MTKTTLSASGMAQEGNRGGEGGETTSRPDRPASGSMAVIRGSGSHISTVEEQIALWETLIGQQKDLSHLSISDAKSYAARLKDLQLPKGCEWCVMPKEKAISEDYWLSMNAIFQAIARKRPLNDSMIGPIHRSMHPAPKFATERRALGRIFSASVNDALFRQKSKKEEERVLYSDGRTEEKLLEIGKSQPGDFIIIPAQWGKARAEKDLMACVRQFAKEEFFFTMLMGASLICANPLLISNEEDPWFACAASQIFYLDAHGRQQKCMGAFCAEGKSLQAAFMTVTDHHPGFNLATAFAL